jgi:NADP-reducing hydrogenase subunit HndA
MSIKTTIPFNGTKEQMEQLLEVIQEHRKMEGALMPVLQGAQEIYGYIPLEVQKTISDELRIPLSEIYGVVTFYSQFTLYPKGKYKVTICLGTACYVKGSGKILEEYEKVLGIPVGACTADMKFSLDATRCIGACGLAPVVMVNDDVYAKQKTGNCRSVLEKYEG